MERLTRPGVAVDPTAARLMFMDSPAKVQNIHDRLLHFAAHSCFRACFASRCICSRLAFS